MTSKWLTTPRAVLLAGGVIGLAIFASLIVAPYRLSGGADGTWRINAITGETQICSVAFGGCRSPIFR